MNSFNCNRQDKCILFYAIYSQPVYLNSAAIFVSAQDLIHDILVWQVR